MVSVSILVVAYRSTDFIAKCLDAIPAAAAATAHEVLLIDNGPGDTAAFVGAHYPEVRIVSGEGNIGFGAGNNRLAAAAKAPLLLLLNPDAQPLPGAIDALVAFAQARPDAAAWGGAMVSVTGEADPGSFLILPKPADYLRATVFGLGAFAPNRTSDAPNGERAAEVLSGGFMMMRTDVFRALGGFDESFFLYSEEIDLFRRFRAAGHKALVTPRAKVVHDTGSGDPLSPARVLYRVTGQMHDAHKHFGPGGRLAAGASIWAMALERWIGGAAIGALSRRERFRALARAWGPVARRPSRWWNGYVTHAVQKRGAESEAR